MVAQLESGRQKVLRLRDIEPRDRVLVIEDGGERWHTVRDVSGEYVSTEERPEGVRMDYLVRHEPMVPVGGGAR